MLASILLGEVARGAVLPPGAPPPREAHMVSSILNMFPQDLLLSSTRVQPLNIRRVEHKDFIDYEVEFVELPEETSDDLEESDNIVISHSESEDDSMSDNPGDKEDAVLDSKVNMETFVTLLQRARTRHRGLKKMSPER